MPDKELICLSSDDEDVEDESPKKKLKTDHELLPPSGIKRDDDEDIIVCKPKRKLQEEDKSAPTLIKKSKSLANGHIDEIIIDGSRESADEDGSRRANKTVRSGLPRMRVSENSNGSEPPVAKSTQRFPDARKNSGNSSDNADDGTRRSLKLNGSGAALGNAPSRASTSNEAPSHSESSSSPEIEVVCSMERSYGGTSKSDSSTRSNGSVKNFPSSRDERPIPGSSTSINGREVRKILPLRVGSSSAGIPSSSGGNCNPGVAKPRAGTSSIRSTNAADKSSTSSANSAPNRGSDSSAIRIIESPRAIPRNVVTSEGSRVSGGQEVPKVPATTSERKKTPSMPRYINIAAINSSGESAPQRPKTPSRVPTPENSKTASRVSSPENSETASRVSSPENSKTETRVSSPESSKKPSRVSTPESQTRIPETSSTFEPQPGCSTDPDYPDKPLLVVKSRIPVCDVEVEDPFTRFLDLVMQYDDSTEMMNIIAKLQRYHDKMNQSYARSREFEQVLNEKCDEIILNKTRKLYVRVREVMTEMMARTTTRKRKRSTNGRDDRTENLGNCHSDDLPNEPAESDEDDEEDADDEIQRNIRKIDRAMKTIDKRIKKLGEAEVNWDDDNNSSFIQLDRYKARMIELWNKRCKYSNEHADAGRPYLRPKHLRVTQIPTVDQAINSFINSKIGAARGKKKKGTSFINAIIFPDYADVLECIAAVNERQNLGMDRRRQEQLGQSAFEDLGQHLQKARQADYWDTFSLSLDDNEDPATNDAELLRKLEENRERSKGNEAKVIEMYVKKQKELRHKNQPEDDDDDDDDDENDDDEPDKKSSCGNLSDSELMEDEDDDDGNAKIADDRAPSPQGSIHEEEEENPEAAKDTEAETNEKNNNLDVELDAVVASPKNSNGVNVNENEVNIVEEHNEEAIKSSSETRTLLRIRSFAKPPETWQASQERPAAVEEPEASSSDPKSMEQTASGSKNIETIDVTEDTRKPAVSEDPKKPHKLKTLTVDGQKIVIKRFDGEATKRIPQIVAVTSGEKKRPSVVAAPVKTLPSDQSSSRNINNNVRAPEVATGSQSRHENIPRRVKSPRIEGPSIRIVPLSEVSKDKTPVTINEPEKTHKLVNLAVKGRPATILGVNGEKAKIISLKRVPFGNGVDYLSSSDQSTRRIVVNRQTSIEVFRPPSNSAGPVPLQSRHSNIPQQVQTRITEGTRIRPVTLGGVSNSKNLFAAYVQEKSESMKLRANIRSTLLPANEALGRAVIVQPNQSRQLPAKFDVPASAIARNSDAPRASNTQQPGVSSPSGYSPPVRLSSPGKPRATQRIPLNFQRISKPVGIASREGQVAVRGSLIFPPASNSARNSSPLVNSSRTMSNGPSAPASSIQRQQIKHPDKRHERNPESPRNP